MMPPPASACTTKQRAPASYLGGTQWGVRQWRQQSGTTGGVCITMYATENQARFVFKGRLADAQRVFPNNPDRWPELVRADIVWRVAK